MNNLRKAAEQALKVLEEINEISKPSTGIPLPAEIDGAMEALRQALSKPKRVLKTLYWERQMNDLVIAGALFDFMGWLTSRKERLVLSGADDASPAVDAIRDFAKMRGLSLDDAKVQDWHTIPQPAQRTWVGLTVTAHDRHLERQRIVEEQHTKRVALAQPECPE